MTAEILAVLAAFSPVFSRPTWKNIQILLIGAILCRGPRRITSVLSVMGLTSIRNFSKYHRVLSRAKWDSLMLSKILLGLLIKLLPESWPMLVAVDETLERRRGCSKLPYLLLATKKFINLFSRTKRRAVNSICICVISIKNTVNVMAVLNVTSQLKIEYSLMNVLRSWMKKHALAIGKLIRLSAEVSNKPSSHWWSEFPRG